MQYSTLLQYAAVCVILPPSNKAGVVVSVSTAFCTLCIGTHHVFVSFLVSLTRNKLLLEFYILIPNKSDMFNQRKKRNGSHVLN